MISRELLTAASLLALDGAYLYLNGSTFGRVVRSIQGQKMSIRKSALILVYPLMLFGLLYFIIWPDKPPSDAALLGLLVFGVFTFTNNAIFKDWVYPATLLDTLWGPVLFAATTFIVQSMYGVARK